MTLQILFIKKNVTFDKIFHSGLMVNSLFGTRSTIPFSEELGETYFHILTIIVAVYIFVAYNRNPISMSRKAFGIGITAHFLVIQGVDVAKNDTLAIDEKILSEKNTSFFVLQISMIF